MLNFFAGADGAPESKTDTKAMETIQVEESASTAKNSDTEPTIVDKQPEEQQLQTPVEETSIENEEQPQEEMKTESQENPSETMIDDGQNQNDEDTSSPSKFFESVKYYAESDKRTNYSRITIDNVLVETVKQCSLGPSITVQDVFNAIIRNYLLEHRAFFEGLMQKKVTLF